MRVRWYSSFVSSNMGYIICKIILSYLGAYNPVIIYGTAILLFLSLLHVSLVRQGRGRLPMIPKPWIVKSA